MLAKAAMQDDVSNLTRTVTAEVANGNGSASDQIAAWRRQESSRAGT
jgi:NAD-specific glutamate dehydrogenase